MSLKMSGVWNAETRRLYLVAKEEEEEEQGEEM